MCFRYLVFIFFFLYYLSRKTEFTLINRVVASSNLYTWFNSIGCIRELRDFVYRYLRCTWSAGRVVIQCRSILDEIPETVHVTATSLSSGPFSNSVNVSSSCRIILWTDDSKAFSEWEWKLTCSWVAPVMIICTQIPKIAMIHHPTVSQPSLSQHGLFTNCV